MAQEANVPFPTAAFHEVLSVLPVCTAPGGTFIAQSETSPGTPGNTIPIELSVNGTPGVVQHRTVAMAVMGGKEI